METHVEKKRERRIRDSRRMLRRAESKLALWFPASDANPLRSDAPSDLSEVFAKRREFARRFADNMKQCSCAGCHSGRWQWGDPTVQEFRCGMAAVDQLVDAGYVDDCVGVRRIRCRCNWI